MHTFVTTTALVGIVIVVASLLSGVLDRSGVPLVAAFLALGLALGPWGLGLFDVTLDSNMLPVLSTLALVLVLFTDAVTLETGELRPRRHLLWRMLLPGTLIPAALTAVSARFLLGLDWPFAAILGAALASTDPVILRSLLRSPALPSAARMALRLETGMNDVVLLPVIVIALVVGGAAHGAGEAAGAAVGSELPRRLIGLFLLGPAIGAAVGWIGISLLVGVRTRMGVRRDYESLYALGLALSAFALAEVAGGSGFLAAFTAGVMVAIQDVELCDCFLEYGEATAEMLMLLTFVAFGASLLWGSLAVVSLPVLGVAAVALLARSLVLYPILGGLGLPSRDRWLITLLGPRGLSSLLLVLLPVFEGVPGAEVLFAPAAFTVLLSVLLHGTGIALFMRRGAPHSADAESTTDADSTTPATSTGTGLPTTPATSPSVTSAVDVPVVQISASRGRPAEIAIDESGLPTVERISIDDLRGMIERGEPFIPVDVRGDKSYRASKEQAVGSIRLSPDDPVRSAKSMRLPRDKIIALYCA